MKRRQRINWEAIVAISTFGLLGIGIYVSFFFDLPSRLTEIAELTTTNRKLSDKALQAQIEANKAIVQSLLAQAEINRSLQVSLLAQQRVQNLAEKAHRMEADIDRLIVEKKTLDAQKSQLTSDLQKSIQTFNEQKAQIKSDLQVANQTLVKTVDAFTNLMYSTRFAEFLSVMQNANAVLIPTIPTKTDEISAKHVVYGFVFMDKRFIHVKQDETSTGQIYDAGALAVVAFEQVSTSADARGLNYTIKTISVDDERFKKFILLLKSRFAIDLTSFFYLKQRIEIDPLKPGPTIRVIDILSKIVASKGTLAIWYIPGSIGDVSYEDSKIRGFWFSGIGNALVLAGGFGDQLKEKMKKFNITSDIKGAGLSVQFNQKEFDETMARSIAVFGETAFAHFRDRLKILDDAWLKELHAETLRLGKEPAFQFDSPDHLRNIYQRWNWNDGLQQQSVVLFHSIVMEDRLNFVLTCSAARFLDNNSISRGPDVLSRLRTCTDTISLLDTVDKFSSKHQPNVSE